MALLFQLFDVEELKSLDAGQLEILRAAIRKELQTSPAVAEAIRANVTAVYNELRAPKAGGTGH
jgi:hypothetical protein